MMLVIFSAFIDSMRRVKLAKSEQIVAQKCPAIEK